MADTELSPGCIHETEQGPPDDREGLLRVDRLYASPIQLTHLLAPFPSWRPVMPLDAALLRLVPFPLARMK